MKKLFKTISWTLIILILVYFLFIYESPKSKELKLEIERKEQVEKEHRIARDLKLKNWIEKDNPVVFWDSILCKGERFRQSPIYSSELENLWIKEGKPILFKGVIIDLKSLDSLNYNIILERNVMITFDYFFITHLRLSLSCTKTKIDTFMKENESQIDEKFGSFNQFFVIAKINEIESSEILGNNSEPVQVRIGKGELIDIVYYGFKIDDGI